MREPLRWENLINRLRNKREEERERQAVEARGGQTLIAVLFFSWNS